MFLKFNHQWGQHDIGDIANVEQTLARRLVGMGIAEYKTDLAKKTTPEIKIPEPVKEPEAEKELESEIMHDHDGINSAEVTLEEKPVEKKKKPKRKYTRREKAVKIEK